MEGYSDQSYEDLLFTKAPVAMAYVGPRGKFTHTNEAFSELVGYSQYELAGIHFASITHPSDVEMDRTEAERLISDPDRDGYQIIKRYLSKDGRVVWCRLCVAALRKNGEFKHYIVHALDLPPADNYKVEQTPTGVSVRPSPRWIDLLRDNPRESMFVFLLAITVGKTVDVAVIQQIAELVRHMFGK